MAEFLIKNTTYTHPDKAVDRAGVHKRGDVIVVMPDGHSWGRAEVLPDFVLVKVPGMQKAAVLGYVEPWIDAFEYEVLSQNAAQGLYVVRVTNKYPGALNQNAITASKIQLFLTNWGCIDISFSTNACQFTFSLWNAVRSKNFWNLSIPAARFTLVDYSSTTGVGRISVDLSGLNPDLAVTASDIILGRGGAIISSDYPTITFEIERSLLLQTFKNDSKRKIEMVVYKRHRYCLSENEMDSIAASGGVVTLSQSQFFEKIIDKTAV